MLTGQPGLDMDRKISRLERATQLLRLRRRETPDQERHRFRLTSRWRPVQPEDTQVGRQDPGRPYRARKISRQCHRVCRKASLPQLAGFGLVQGRDVPFLVLAGGRGLHQGQKSCCYRYWLDWYSDCAGVGEGCCFGDCVPADT